MESLFFLDSPGQVPQAWACGEVVGEMILTRWSKSAKVDDRMSALYRSFVADPRLRGRII